MNSLQLKNCLWMLLISQTIYFFFHMASNHPSKASWVSCIKGWLHRVSSIKYVLLEIHIYSALLWQKEASDKSDISCKRAKCVCHLHWRQWNIIMSYLTYLLAGWVFMHKIWPERRAHWVKYENIHNSDLDGTSLAYFCESRAVYAVKAQTSLAPLSRFLGSHVTTAHAHQCCRFQSYAKTVPSRMKLTSKIYKAWTTYSWDPRQRTTWSRLVTSDFNSVLLSFRFAWK